MEPISPPRIGNVRGSGIPPSRPRCMTHLAPPTKAGPFSRSQLLVNQHGAQVVEDIGLHFSGTTQRSVAIVARKIIALAKDGERNPDLLCEKALTGLQLRKLSAAGNGASLTDLLQVLVHSAIDLTGGQGEGSLLPCQR